MQNKNHKTHSRFELSGKPERLIFLEKPRAAESKKEELDKAKVLSGLGTIEAIEDRSKPWKNSRDTQRVQAFLSRIGIAVDYSGSYDLQTKEAVKIYQRFLTQQEKYNGKIDGYFGEKCIEGSLKLREKSKSDVITKAKQETKTLKTDIEGVRARECRDGKNETVASIVEGIAGAEAGKIEEVTVKKKNGAEVKLKKEGDDFVALEGKFKGKHFPIYKGDIVIIGHDVLSADSVNPETGKKLSIENRQTKNAVEKGIEGGLLDDEESPEKITLGGMRSSETNSVKEITEIGIREACNIFIGERRGLAGVFLEESKRHPDLFDAKSGKLKKTTLDDIAKIITAAAGRVEENIDDGSIWKKEIIQDARTFGGEVAAFVIAPTVLNCIIALAQGSQMAIVGYFPVVWFDCSDRGILGGQLEKFDRGSIKLLEEISILGGEIEAAKQLGENVDLLEEKKRKLERIAITRKMNLIEEIWKGGNLDEKTMKGLENDLAALLEKAKEYSGITVSAADLKEYSSEEVFAKQNKEYQRLQRLAKRLRATGVYGNLDTEAMMKNVGEESEATKRSLDKRYNMTKQLQVWYERWLGGDIENPEEAIQEFDEMIEDELFGLNETKDRLKYYGWGVGLGEKGASFVLKDMLGIGKGKKLTRKTPEKAGKDELSFLGILALASDPAGRLGTAMPKDLEERLAKIDSKSSQVQDTLGKLKEYFTTDFSIEGLVTKRPDKNLVKLAESILQNDKFSDAEKVCRLAMIVSRENIVNIDKQLTLKTNIENDKKARDVLEDVKGALETKAFLTEFKKSNPEFAGELDKIFADAAWIERKIDLKNLDQNASLHAEINDTLQAPLEKIAQFSAVLAEYAEGGLDKTEKTKIKEAIDGLAKGLAAARKDVEKLLAANADEVRASHHAETLEGIKNSDLKELNKKFIKFAPITDEALPGGEAAAFTKFAESLLGKSNILRDKGIFMAKMKVGFEFAGKHVNLKNYDFYKGSEKGTSHLPMVSSENIEGLLNDATKLQLARFLNLLILNVDQGNKNIAETFYENTGERAGMHIRDSETAEAIGNAEWLSEEKLEEFESGYVANTGSGNVESKEHFISPGFGGAYKLEFKRMVTLANGSEFEVTYHMLARQKCFNAVFISKSDIKSVGLDSLIQADLAGVVRQLILLGIPIYKEFGGDEKKAAEIKKEEPVETPECKPPGPNIKPKQPNPEPIV